MVALRMSEGDPPAQEWPIIFSPQVDVGKGRGRALAAGSLSGRRGSGR
jgi:hypothetical protein